MVAVRRLLTRSYFQVESIKIQVVIESRSARALFLASHETQIAAKFPLAKPLSQVLLFRIQIVVKHLFALN